MNIDQKVEAHAKPGYDKLRKQAYNHLLKMMLDGNWAHNELDIVPTYQVGEALYKLGGIAGMQVVHYDLQEHSEADLFFLQRLEHNWTGIGSWAP